MSRLRIIAKSVAQLMLGVGLFAGLIVWIAPSWHEVAATVDLRLHWLGLSLAGSFLANVVTAARWKRLTETMGGTPLPYGIYFHYLALTRLLGQFLPTVVVDVFGRGAALRAAGSQSRLGHLITPVILERLLDLLLPLTLLIWAVGLSSSVFLPVDPWLLLAAVTAGFIAITIPLLGPLVRLALWAYGRLTRLRRREPSPVARPVVAVDRSLALRIVGWSIARYVGILLQYWGAGAGLGAIVDPLTVARAAPVAQLAGLIGITPGGLGVQESGWVATLTQLGEAEATIVIFMAGTRLMMVINFGILSGLSWPWRRAQSPAS